MLYADVWGPHRLGGLGGLASGLDGRYQVGLPSAERACSLLHSAYYVLHTTCLVLRVPDYILTFGASSFTQSGWQCESGGDGEQAALGQ